MVSECHDEGEEIVDGVATHVIFKNGRVPARACIDTKSDRVNEIMFPSQAIADIFHTSHIHRLWRAVEESFQRLAVVFGKVPIAPIIIAGATRHDTKLEVLAVGNVGGHESVDSLTDGAVSPKDKELTDSVFLREFACQL